MIPLQLTLRRIPRLSLRLLLLSVIDAKTMLVCLFCIGRFLRFADALPRAPTRFMEGTESIELHNGKVVAKQDAGSWAKASQPGSGKDLR